MNFNHLVGKFYFKFFIVSIGAMGFGTSVYMYATKILGPVKSSAFIFSVPFIAITTSHFFLDEVITLNIVAGGLLSLLCVYIANR